MSALSHVVLYFVVLCACSAPALNSDLASAEAAENAGDYANALTFYQAAVHTCQRESRPARRKHTCASAHLNRAELLDRMGEKRKAAQAYERTPDALAGDPAPSAAALYRAGLLYLDLGEATRAYTLLWKTITDYPDEAFAGDALKHVVRDGRERNPRQLARVLGQLMQPLARTAVADNILFAMADIAENDFDDPRAALGFYDKIGIDYPDTGHYDDAYWHGARLCRALGDPRGAVVRLEKLLDRYEVAFGAGSYNSIWFDNAQLELGRVLRDDLREYERAIAAFATLAENYPASVLRDDALWDTAVTWDRMNRADEVCQALAQLAKDWPDSKYQLDKAPALRREHACP